MLKKPFEPEQLLQRITHEIQQSHDLSQIFGTTVSEIRAFLEIDRVKIYQFAENGSGKVVAESRHADHLPSLLGLHFPATDIPPQARERFVKGQQRVIVDVTSKRKTLSPCNGGQNGYSLPLQESEYSAVDPCHVQYLLGMGVLASLTIPIFYQTQLWGLLAIHHRNPRQFSEQELQIIELLVNQLSIAIAQSTLINQAQQQVQHEAILQRLNSLLEQSLETKPRWQEILSETVQSLQGCGGRLYIVPEPTEKLSELYLWGEQPSHSYLEKDPTWQDLIGIRDNDKTAGSKENGWQDFGEALILAGLSHPGSLSSHSSGLCLAYTLLDFYRTKRFQSLADLFEPTPIRAILLIPLQYRQQWLGYLTIFANDCETETLWAGQPTEKHQSQPRPSFEPWCELKQQAHQWSLAEHQLAQQIGVNLCMAVMRQRVKVMLKHQTSHDPLTQLPNRLLFNEQLSLALVKAHQQGSIVGVIVLDLDRFTTVNDTLGYEAGDCLLKSVAKRLQDQLSSATAMADLPLLARWHGDEFTILLPHLESSEEIRDISQNIVNSFHSPFYVTGQELYLTASVGSALAPYDGEDAETLLKNAEVALNCAKQQGKNTYQVYSPTIGNRDLARLELEVNLRKALGKDELFLNFQPQVDLKTGKIVALEALIRWQHPQWGLVPPNQFIPLAEETGLIDSIGEWVLRTACLQHQAWRLAGLNPVRMAVNVSGRQFQQGNLSETIQRVLQETEMDPCFLEIEITETTAMHDINHTIAVLEELAGMGIQIAIDDFGMGYSSLNVLKHFPVHTLKIDKSFVRDLVTDTSDAAIAKTIVALGHGLKLQVLAEGVETAEQLEFLREIECDLVQGHLLSKPLSPEAVVQRLRQGQVNLPTGQPKLNIGCVAQGKSTSITDVACQSPPLTLVSVTQEQLQQKILEYEKLKADLKRQVTRENLVSAIAQKIRQSLDLKEILHTTVTEVRHFLQTDRVLLYRFNSDWTGTVAVESVATGWQSILEMTIDDPCFRKNYIKYYRQGRVRAIADIQEAGLSNCYVEMLSQFQVRGNLVVPVLHQDQLWGLLIAHHCRGRRKWEPVEVSLVTELATQAAIAIHQGELYQRLEKANQELQNLANLDGLTQVANRRQFDQYLEQEWYRAQREQQPLCLILCDIDFFKRYNDSYGHQAGDRCLQQVAQALKAACKRTTDLVARYGGEEFAIILPQTPPQGALRVAEEMRVRVRALDIHHPQSDVARCVTLSLGIASLVPQEGQFPEALIAAADKALYKAKAAGRDQSCVNY